MARAGYDGHVSSASTKRTYHAASVDDPAKTILSKERIVAYRAYVGEDGATGTHPTDSLFFESGGERFLALYEVTQGESALNSATRTDRRHSTVLE